MLYNIHVKLTEKVKQFCLQYVTDNIHDRSYSNDELLEYYPNANSFITNFKFENICIGKLPTGSVVKHIDDGRDSALIIPITNSPLIIVTDNGTYEFTDSFLLDTAQKHGALSDLDSIFVALDFEKSFTETKIYLESFDKLTIDTR